MFSILPVNVRGREEVTPVTNLALLNRYVPSGVLDEKEPKIGMLFTAYTDELFTVPDVLEAANTYQPL